MSADSTGAPRTARRSLSISLLAAYSLLVGVVTFIPQLYYVLFALNRDAFPIGPDANFLGAVWYNYILGGHQGGYSVWIPARWPAAWRTCSCLGHSTSPRALACCA